MEERPASLSTGQTMQVIGRKSIQLILRDLLEGTKPASVASATP